MAFRTSPTLGLPVTQIEYPDVSADRYEETVQNAAPITLQDPKDIEYWDLSLQEAMHLALKNSKVLRDLGGLVLDSPTNVSTIYDTAITQADPRFGTEAALSEFDANWTTQAFFEKNDRALNNQFFGGGTRILQQDLLEYTSGLSKRSATGGLYSVRHNVGYDFNNAPGNFFTNGAWGTNIEAEARHPLLQGSGVEFNRIAGPGSTPGDFNGVLLARLDTDQTLADFEIGVRDLISDIETTYWELYFSYRDLNAKIAARDRALDTWRQVKALYETGQTGGEAAQEAQTREQYYRLKEDVQNALSGRTQERSRATTFRGTAGVYNNERKLRLMLGIKINDGRLIRPADEPTLADVQYDWDEALVEALMRREELRKQKWIIKQRELELIAAKNHLLPQLDAVARYRWRGFGHHLVDANGGATQFDNAVQDLVSGNFQEWQAGFEFTLPVGFRQAHAGVRHAQLQNTRARAILDEQQREVTHDLSNAISEKDRAYATAKTNFNRREAAEDQLHALEAVYNDADTDRNQMIRLLDLILDAQRRLADAESKYFRSTTEYMIAIKTIHATKGSLLDYNEILLSEGAWARAAYSDAADRSHLRRRAWKLENYVMQSPPTTSGGRYAQQVESNNNLKTDAHSDTSLIDNSELNSSQPQLPHPPNDESVERLRTEVPPKNRAGDKTPDKKQEPKIKFAEMTSKAAPEKKRSKPLLSNLAVATKLPGIIESVSPSRLMKTVSTHQPATVSPVIVTSAVENPDTLIRLPKVDVGEVPATVTVQTIPQQAKIQSSNQQSSNQQQSTQDSTIEAGIYQSFGDN